MKRDREERSRLSDVYQSYSTNEEKQRSWSTHNAGNRCIEAERESCVLEAAGINLTLTEDLALDIGCGSGQLFPMIIRSGVKETRIIGVDLVFDRLPQATLRYPLATVLQADGARLPFRDCSMRFVSIFTVFSSVLDANIRFMIADEAVRVLHEDGIIIVYDIRYNNPWNKYVKRVTKGEMKAMFGMCSVSCRSITVLPQLVRRIGRHVPTIYPLLARIPFLCTHWLCIIRKS